MIKKRAKSKLDPWIGYEGMKKVIKSLLDWQRLFVFLFSSIFPPEKQQHASHELAV